VDESRESALGPLGVLELLGRVFWIGFSLWFAASTGWGLVKWMGEAGDALTTSLIVSGAVLCAGALYLVYDVLVYLIWLASQVVQAACFPEALAKGEVEGESYWDDVWKQFQRYPQSVWSLYVIAVLFFIAAWAPILAEGRPLIWMEQAADGTWRTTYPLLRELIAPETTQFQDYLFNYLFFCSLFVPLCALPVYFLNRYWRLKRATRSARLALACALGGVLAILPFIHPHQYERRATRTELKANPAGVSVKDFTWFRSTILDIKDYSALHAEKKDSGTVWAIFPPIPYGPRQELPHAERLQAPDSQHWMGTDAFDYDVLSRMIHGARISISVGFVAVTISVLIGIVIGGLAGYYRGWVDILISRLIEIVICFPSFFLILTILALMDRPSIFYVMLIIGVTSWPGVARLVRGEFLKLSGQDFVQAARALGCSEGRVMFLHILPNALGPVLVSAAFGVAGAVLTESGLSYLGLGASPDIPSWGNMIKQGANNIEVAWWLLFYPGLLIFITVTVYNLAGDGLRDAMDPRMRKR
jgi:peptide/nickel transport system permease protein